MLDKLTSRHTWDDLVLGQSVVSELRRLAEEVGRRRSAGWLEIEAKLDPGAGVTALFTGPSGTGKTMAAQVLSNELGIDLYRVDLSNVVNKYIGETEKNLARLFDSAEKEGWILLFDEADALFGERTEVKETNYLLQRIERYPGLAILTTNLKRNIDEAFLRRLRYVVDFG